MRIEEDINAIISVIKYGKRDANGYITTTTISPQSTLASQLLIIIHQPNQRINDMKSTEHDHITL